MKLTWVAFLEWVDTVKKLNDSIENFTTSENKIKDENRIIAATSKYYIENFKDKRFREFSNHIRIS